MRQKAHKSAICFVLLPLFVVPDHASASEWGCEVLLCASSSNPSWRGVAACHPPMTKLISAMKKPGFSWPICPQAGTGNPGHEQYGDCPEGYAVASSQSGHSMTLEPDQCVKSVNACAEARANGRYYSVRRDQGCLQTIRIPRPVRSEPYFFDIRNDATGKNERHWFELNR